MTEPIVITGLEMLCALGHEPAEVTQGLLTGKNGIIPSRTVHLNSPVDFGAVDLDLKLHLGQTGWRHHTRSALMACLTSRKLLESTSRQVPEQTDPNQIGLAIGYNIDCFGQQFDEVMLQQELKLFNPPVFLNASSNAVVANVSIYLQVHGFILSLSTGFTAGLEAIALACQALTGQRAQLVLAGSVEEQTTAIIQGFAQSSTASNFTTLPGVFTPGLAGPVVAGEGCVMLRLEKAGLARKRGLKARVFIAGFGLGFNSQAPEQEDPWAAQTAIQQALSEAQVKPQEIDAIFVAANGDRLQDVSEALALENIFGANLPPGAAVKGAWGETWHASGALAVAAAMLCLEAGMIPPTVRLHSGALAERMNLSTQARPVQARYALVTALDRNQKAAALVLGWLDKV